MGVAKVLIVGGFGYLGSILTDIMSRQTEKFVVDVYDNSLFKTDETLKKTILFRKEVTKSGTLENEYDLIIWLGSIDIPFFYEKEKFLPYVQKMEELFEMLLKKGTKFINGSTYLLNYPDFECVQMRDYYLRLEKLVQEKNQVNFKIPSLHGPSPSMRFDTCVNEIMLAFILHHQVILNEDWLTKIPLANVFSCARFMMDKILENEFDKGYKNVEYVTEIKNLLEVAFILKNELEVESSVEIIGKSEKNFELFGFSKLSLDKILIRESFKQILINIKNNALPDFYKEKYNYHQVISNAFESLDFLERLRNF